MRKEYDEMSGENTYHLLHQEVVETGYFYVYADNPEEALEKLHNGGGMFVGNGNGIVCNTDFLASHKDLVRFGTDPETRQGKRYDLTPEEWRQK